MHQSDCTSSILNQTTKLKKLTGKKKSFMEINFQNKIPFVGIELCWTYLGTRPTTTVAMIWILEQFHRNYWWIFWHICRQYLHAQPIWEILLIHQTNIGVWCMSFREYVFNQKNNTIFYAAWSLVRHHMFMCYGLRPQYDFLTSKKVKR